MRRLSASDAISPAWNHTKKLLLSPPDWRLLLKIGAVAYFANLGGINLNFSNPGSTVEHLPTAVRAGLIAVAVGLGLFFLVVGLVLLYVGSRLQFVLFEIVLRADTRVGPIWKRYGAATWRWLGIKVLLFLALLLCMLPVLLPAIVHFARTLPAHSPEGAVPNFAALFGALLGFFFVLLVLVVLFAAVYALFADFGLPSIALEATSLGETTRRVFGLLREDTGQVLLFLLLRFVLGLAFAIGMALVLVLVLLVLAIPLGGLGAVAWFALRNAGTGGHIVLGLCLCGLALLFFALLLAAILIVAAVPLVFLQAYALYFLGGRYPRLGEYLEPTLAHPFTPPPPLAGPDEEDDDIGPDLPMNPALA